MTELRVVSFNVHSCVGTDGHYSLNRVSTTLASLQPSIVCLQETEVNECIQKTRIWSQNHCHNQPRVIANDLSFDHASFAPAIQSKARSSYQETHGSHDGGLFGIAILSCFPIIETKKQSYAKFGQKTLRNAMACLIQLPCGSKVWVVNTHLGCCFSGKEQCQQAVELVEFISSIEVASKDDHTIKGKIQEFTTRRM